MSAPSETMLMCLASVCARAGLSNPTGVNRLTGGAMMESWLFSCGDERFVLRRAPSEEFMSGRPFGHDVEAAIIRAAYDKGVTAPQVIAELQPGDGLGSGFIMRALPGTASPKEILEMNNPKCLLLEAARDLARIHLLKPDHVPDTVPVMNYREAVADLRVQFEEAGGDRPVIALGLKWLEDNCPEQSEPVLIHGDYRLGNLLAENSRLTGVLDWEIAHFGDRHEDLAFGCMAVWRFSRYDRPALGLGSLEDYFEAYEAESGTIVDRQRFRYWLIHRTVWWALGCLNMARMWRSGEDRMLERVVISRRTSENELDLLMILEDDAPEAERSTPMDPGVPPATQSGEASDGEIAIAISEWLETIKPRMEGHDRFQLAVARNALGMIARDDSVSPQSTNYGLAQAILTGKKTLASPGLLRELRKSTFNKLTADIPKYPALEVARAKWMGE